MSEAHGNSTQSPRNTRSHASKSRGYQRCVWCMAAGSDVRLWQCGGCRMNAYCNLVQSMDCSKAVWTSHKTTCRRNQALVARIGPVAGILRPWAAHHRNNLTQEGCVALDLVTGPSRGMRNIMVVTVVSRPGRPKAETSFEETDVTIRRLKDTLPATQLEEMHNRMLKDVASYNSRVGGCVTALRAFCVAVVATDAKSTANELHVNVFADYCFMRDLEYILQWRTILFDRLNHGISTQAL